MKNLMNLKGVKPLSKMEQKIVYGGLLEFEYGGMCQPTSCSSDSHCPGSCTCMEDIFSGNYCQ